jgi:tellurite resistance-related uncharacterized protein
MIAMPTSPPALEAYRQTPVFDESSIPAGLLRRHTTKSGVWARIHVLEGELLFRFLEPTPRELRLTPARVGEVEPEVPHEVAVCGPVRFFVEFLRPAGESR